MLAAFSPIIPFTLGSQIFLGRETCPEVYWTIYPPPSSITLNFQECYKPPGSATLIKVSVEDTGPKGAYITDLGDQALFGLWEAGITRYLVPDSADTLILEMGDICIGTDEEFVWAEYPPPSPIEIEYKTTCEFMKDANAVNVSY